MKNYISLADAIADFHIYESASQAEHQHQDIEILCVLAGQCHITVEGQSHTLTENQFIIINAHMPHSHDGDERLLYASVQIDYFKFCNTLGQMRVTLQSKTIDQSPELRREFEYLFLKMFNYYDCREDYAARLDLSSLYYHLLYLLAVNCVVKNDLTDESKRTEELRFSEIYFYIQDNYKTDLSLIDLSKHLYLSPAYLSKYIKRTFGSNFSDYVNGVRLQHAVNDMKYSDKSITRIALDNGFPNTAAFGRVFKARYGQTPSVWKESETKQENRSISNENHSDSIHKRLQEYFDNRGTLPSSSSQVNEALVKVDATRYSHFHKAWNGIINAGMSGEVFDSGLREQLLEMRKKLGFKYVRFGDLYSPVLFLDFESNKQKYNFSKLDRLFDFLIDNDMLPYIELGFKPKLVLRRVQDTEVFLVEQQREILFPNQNEYRRFLQQFCRHYTNRYGSEKVGQWYFEQWMDPRLALPQTMYHEYFETFEAAYSAIKSVSPHFHIGGGGFSATNDDVNSILSAWRKRPVKPDFLTIYCYPYASNEHMRSHSSLLEQIGIIREAMGHHGFEMTELHVSEWNFTVSDRNTLNDSCFKAAYIIKNVIETLRAVDLMGYWNASDLLSEFTDTNEILHGGNGLLSREGIHKPSYYAFEFLNKMEKYLLYAKGNCILTRGGHDQYAVVCHNYCHPNLKYYLQKEDELQIEEHQGLYENTHDLLIRMEIHNVRSGHYWMKVYSINLESGSVQTEWKRMGYMHGLNRDEIDYLKRVSTPRLTIQKLETQGNALVFETRLKPQEIQHIQLLYQIEADYTVDM